MECLQLYHNKVTSNHVLEKCNFGKWFNVIDYNTYDLQKQKLLFLSIYGGKKHHAHVCKQRVCAPLTICTLSLTRVCIRLVYLQDSYRYMANLHQAIKPHCSSNVLRTLDPVFFFHQQLLTFYHNTINFLHLMTRINLTCCVPQFTYDKRLDLKNAKIIWSQLDFRSLTLNASSYTEKKMIVFLYVAEGIIKKQTESEVGIFLDTLVCVEVFTHNFTVGNRKIDFGELRRLETRCPKILKIRQKSSWLPELAICSK